MSMSRSIMVSDRISGFSNALRSLVNQRRWGMLFAGVLFWVGWITTSTDRRCNGWNKFRYGVMDNDENGKLTPFARVVLTKH